jgi:hypothetical protein
VQHQIRSQIQGLIGQGPRKPGGRHGSECR